MTFFKGAFDGLFKAEEGLSWQAGAFFESLSISLLPEMVGYSARVAVCILSSLETTGGPSEEGKLEIS